MASGVDWGDIRETPIPVWNAGHIIRDDGGEEVHRQQEG